VYLFGAQEKSNRNGFIYWNGEKMYGVNWARLQAGLGRSQVRTKIATDPEIVRDTFP
jgi:hypothetical protein